LRVQVDLVSQVLRGERGLLGEVVDGGVESVEVAA
jgi:hypothetical protein